MKLKDALKYLGTKVNGAEPKGYYVTDIIRGIGDDYTGGGGGGGGEAADNQERISFAVKLVINSNGAQFGGNDSPYNWETLDDHPWAGYTVKQFRYGDNPVSDMDTIKEYLKFMTGSDFVPEYNLTEPHDTFIYLSSNEYTDDQRVWKYQYVEGYGLLAFLVTQFPFALKSEIPVIPETSKMPSTYRVNGTIDNENHRVVFDLNNLSEEETEAKAIMIRVYIDANNDGYNGVKTENYIYSEGQHRYVSTSTYDYGNLSYGVIIGQMGELSLPIYCNIDPNFDDLSKITEAVAVVTLF